MDPLGTPVKHLMRSATADAELAGRMIAKGEWLIPSYPAGKRDDAVFNDPFKFDIERSPNKHLAFGYGAHVCLVQRLGWMEISGDFLGRVSQAHRAQPPVQEREPL